VTLAGYFYIKNSFTTGKGIVHLSGKDTVGNLYVMSFTNTIGHFTGGLYLKDCKMMVTNDF
jgi:hypothetical protein